MERFKALLIEEIVIIIFMIMTGVACMGVIPANKEVLTVMLYMGAFAAIGKTVEALVDHTLCKGYEKKGRLRKFLRMLICFVLISIACFSVFFASFITEPFRFLTILFLTISAMFAVTHLILSSIIDRMIKGTTYIYDDLLSDVFIETDEEEFIYKSNQDSSDD